MSPPPPEPHRAPVGSRPYRPRSVARPRGDLPSSPRPRGGSCPRGSGPRRRRGLIPTLIVLGIVVFFVAAYFPAGGVRGAPAAVPSLSGYYIVGNGAALVAVGYVGWADIWTPAPNATQVFSNQLYLVFFNLHDYPVVVSVLARESGWSYRTTANVSAVSEGAVTVLLPTDVNWVTCNLTFDGVTYWASPVATPISLLPNYILNIGGLDLFALTLVSFMIIVSASGFTLGKWAMRRAVWAPPFRLVVWGHVCIAIILGLVFFFYQQIDALFAGWSPLVYPWITFPMMFLTSLSYYNRAHRVEIIQGVVTESNELGIRRTEMRIGRTGGMLVAVGESWGQFWARFFGHHAVIDDGDTAKPRVLLLPVDNNPSPTASAWEKRAALKEKEKRRIPTTADALTKFPVLDDTGSKRGTIDFFAFAKGSQPVEPHFAYLTIHKWVTKRVKVGTNAITGEPVVEPREKRVLTWPHYVGPTANTAVDLENRHYLPAAMAWLGHATVRDLGHVISLLKQQVAALSAGFEGRVNDEVYTQLRTEKYLRNRATSGITEEEAAALAHEAATLLTPRKAATEAKP